MQFNQRGPVSTHSRAEAAAQQRKWKNAKLCGFNTQPRGGGCDWDNVTDAKITVVSTHSRAEAAAYSAARIIYGH